MYLCNENHDAEWYETLNAKDNNIHFQLDTRAMYNVLASAGLKKINKNLKVVPTFFNTGVILWMLYSLWWFCSTALCMERSNASVGYIFDQTMNPVLGGDTL